MGEAAVYESMDQSEVRSESLGVKRPLEGDGKSDSANKKARGGSEVRPRVNVKKVAEIVLVLATIGKMRAGRKPTPVEIKMMTEAREKLVEICKEFSPKVVFPNNAFGTITKDLGLNLFTETKIGIRPPKMSIAEKLQLTKQKMEKSEVFPLHSATYTPPATSHTVRVFPSDKADHAPVLSVGSKNHSTVFHASTVPNSRTLPYHLPTSEVRPGRPSVFTESPVQRAGRPHLRSDERLNDHQKWTPPSRDYMNKPLTCQTCKTEVNEVNTTLVCDACEKGYHLKCVNLVPKSISRDKWQEWHCVKCLSITNGKPLPLIYGPVVRNINTPNMSSIIKQDQETETAI